MITTAIKRSVITAMVAGLAFIGGLAYAALLALPNIEQLRQTIDDRRASIIVSQQEQSNLASLSNNIEDLQTKQADLDKHTWSFAAEENFFSGWETLADAQTVLIGQPSIAEVTPTGQPIIRPVTVVMTGTTANVLATLNAVQRLDPLVVIDKIGITPGVLGNVIATVEAQTIWK